MKFKQFYLGCLAHASYYIGSGDEAAIIDPQRDVQQYLDEAKANDQTIKYVIETHSHADFVSGHIELAEKTGAEIVFGQKAKTEFPTLKVKDGDVLNVGKIKLKFLETPGHTPDGITILAENTEDASEPVKMFTGDTLFIGDVGRPDLVGSRGFTARQMGEMMYDSLYEKILPLPDATEVYPAHGAGSLCGKSLSKELWSTLGQQRKMNYALQPMSKEEFTKIVAADQPEVPAYFPKSAARNLQGAAALEDLPKPEQMTTEEIKNFDGVVLDVRTGAEFGAAHVPNAVNIGLGGQFASWSGTIIAIGTPIVIVAETNEQVEEAVMRLTRIGMETVKGFILFGDYTGEKATIEQVTVDKVKEAIENKEDIQFVDVRRVAEHANGHAPQTTNLPLDILAKEAGKLNPDKPTFVICQSGYRSSLGTSVLENAGVKKIHNVIGGTTAWTDAGFDTEVSATACANSK
ncbi:MAG: MBL fold metallo-hydrolase [Pyrinomonadaceae bacterium]|nr:MBL fold metallo-hydrolase [Pyrinomonadaceae bacterium]